MASRIPDFYRLQVSERIRTLYERGLIQEEHYNQLLDGVHTLNVDAADNMIENVVGVFGLPMGLGLNFIINDKPYIVPLVVEEPSIVAALSSAAKIIRSSGGFKAECTESLLMGQIQVVDVAHTSKARHAILENKESILNLANSLHPNMVARGGGAKELEVVIHSSASERGDMLAVHIHVDTCDAMGANLVNTMCEGVAPLIERLTNGRVFLRILSNLTDRSLVTARCSIGLEQLAGKGYTGEEVRDGIILANEFASVSPYRAATHNKGIMNGIDAVAVATGNDWRAIEAAAHAFAGRGKSYTCLTKWYKGENGELVGSIEVPLKVGTVGGSLQTNPAVSIAHAMLGVQSAKELAEVMGSVGLAQNFSAIKALATDGIQRGHMTLHARSVAMTAGATPENFDAVVEHLVEDGEIKVWKAKEIISKIEAGGDIELVDNSVEEVEQSAPEPLGSGYGKVILLGEHAVVYGSHALAAPVELSVDARVQDSEGGTHIMIPRWGVEQRIDFSGEHENSLTTSLATILKKLNLQDRSMTIEVWPHVPRAMGLGGSAALAVGVIRALSEHYKLSLSDLDVNGLAFDAEKVAHGTPSGIDNTLATYRKFMLYQKGQPPKMEPIELSRPIPIVIGMSGVESLTAKMVAKVQRNWTNNKFLYERIFAEIDGLTLQGVKALKNYDLEALGELMNIGQGLLNALGVSSWELEELIQIARVNGALGAKLTGGGGGGSMVAICPENQERVATAMRRAGYRAIITQIG